MDEKNLTPLGEFKDGATEPPAVKQQNTPPQMQEIFEMMTMGIGPSHPPYADKITSEHITQILKISEKNQGQSFSLNILWASMGFAFLIGAMFFLVDKHIDLFREIISFLLGIGFGFGIKKRSL